MHNYCISDMGNTGGIGGRGGEFEHGILTFNQPNMCFILIRVAFN